MKKKIFVSLLATLLLASVNLARAQQPVKVPRIGYVSGSGDPSNPGPLVDSFRQGLRDLGYIEGKNILIEFRSSEGNPDSSPRIVAELVQLKIDVLFIPTLPGIRAAKQATKTIPIVMVTTVDPVAAGMVDSLAHPVEISRGSPDSLVNWVENAWNCLRRPFRQYLASESFGMEMTSGAQLLVLRSTRRQRVI